MQKSALISEDLDGYPQRSSSIEEFYGLRCGFKMFDPAGFTPAIKEYMHAEYTEVQALITQRSYDHLLEVGCGPGTYAACALQSGASYDGIDVVGRLIAEGRERVKELARKFSLHGELHHSRLENFKSYSELLYPRRNRSAALLPFNCFGNLEAIDASLSALRSLECDVIIGVFSSDETTTQERLRYYKVCGCTDLQAVTSPHGALITSQEGLYSYAFNPISIAAAFARSDYRLESSVKLSSWGLMLHFCRSGH